jgi:hypothetical protein
MMRSSLAVPLQISARAQHKHCHRRNPGQTSRLNTRRLPQKPDPAWNHHDLRPNRHILVLSSLPVLIVNAVACIPMALRPDHDTSAHQQSQ